MLISPALAHGASGVDSIGSLAPLILLAIAVVFVLVFVGEAKWRKYGLRRDDGGEQRHRRRTFLDWSRRPGWNRP